MLNMITFEDGRYYADLCISHKIISNSMDLNNSKKNNFHIPLGITNYNK